MNHLNCQIEPEIEICYFHAFFNEHHVERYCCKNRDPLAREYRILVLTEYYRYRDGNHRNRASNMVNRKIATITLHRLLAIRKQLKVGFTLKFKEKNLHEISKSLPIIVNMEAS